MQAKTFQEYLQGIKRRKWLLSAIFTLLFACTLAIAFLLSPVYQSTASILIEQQEIPQDLVRTTVTSFADQRIQMISQRVMTRRNLMEIIEKYNLYQDDRLTQATEVILGKMRKDISLDLVSADVVDPRNGMPTQATIAFTISYENINAAIAQKVANELTTLFLKENIKTRKQTATEALAFLTDESEKVNKEMQKLETKLAAFKEKNAGSLPDLVQLNMTMLNRIEDEQNRNEADLRALKERKIYLESELAQVNPNTELYSETGERILGLPDRIKVLKSKLAGATALYGEEHPSVIRLKKELDGLKETTSADNATTYSSKINELEAELGQMRKKYSESHPDILRINREIKSLKKIEKDAIQDESSEVVPQNPIYLKLQVEIEATNSEMTALLEKQEKLNIRYNEYETRLAKTPQIEREFRVLTRDYESAWAKYRELKAKQMEARIAAALEVESKGERFTLIDPPQLPEEPIKPNRLVIVILGFILSTVSAFGLTIILETMDSTIRGRKTVASIMGLPPLATIPYIKNPADSRKKFVLSSVIVLTVFLVVGMSAWMVHLYYKPLDVLWYVALKRIGLTA